MQQRAAETRSSLRRSVRNLRRIKAVTAAAWPSPAMMQPTSLAARPVPRYTSYPTAPHFSGDVMPEHAAAWLAALPDDSLGSLYLHVPFCRELCHYCGCHTKATRQDAPVAAYAETLADEIRLARRLIGRRLPVTTIHWGGGTPSILPADAFARLAGLIGEAFAIVEGAEHAIELDPRYVTADLARGLAAAGVGRASLGVQDLDPAVQAAIGRIQPTESVVAAVDRLRDAGIAALNFDLMFGLPHQTVDSIRRTADAVIALAPSRLAVFGYAHVPWMKTHQRQIDEAALPGTEARLALEAAIRDRLVAAGYVAVGFDHFARPDDSLAAASAEGRLKRNFQGYTTDPADVLLGFGASAISRLPQGYLQNVPAVGGWRRLVEEGRPPVARGHVFSGDDLMRAAVIERLMGDFCVDLEREAARHAVDPSVFRDDLAALAPLADKGLVAISGWRVSVPPAAHTLVRLVAAGFDAYRGSGRGRHAAAV